MIRLLKPVIIETDVVYLIGTIATFVGYSKAHKPSKAVYVKFDDYDKQVVLMNDYFEEVEE